MDDKTASSGVKSDKKNKITLLKDKLIDHGRIEGLDRHRSVSLIPDRYDESADGRGKKKLAASQTMESDRSVKR